jgi:hypothetical protein
MGSQSGSRIWIGWNRGIVESGVNHHTGEGGMPGVLPSECATYDISQLIHHVQYPFYAKRPDIKLIPYSMLALDTSFQLLMPLRVQRCY